MDILLTTFSWCTYHENIIGDIPASVKSVMLVSGCLVVL